MRVRDLTRAFPGVVALAEVTAAFFSDGVHCIPCGERAGKSATANVLGMRGPGAGDVFVDMASKVTSGHCAPPSITASATGPRPPLLSAAWHEVADSRRGITRDQSATTGALSVVRLRL